MKSHALIKRNFLRDISATEKNIGYDLVNKIKKILNIAPNSYEYKNKNTLKNRFIE